MGEKYPDKAPPSNRATLGGFAVKVVSYSCRGKHGVGVVSGANGLIALSSAAPDLPNDLRRIFWKSTRRWRACARLWPENPRICRSTTSRSIR